MRINKQSTGPIRLGRPLKPRQGKHSRIGRGFVMGFKAKTSSPYLVTKTGVVSAKATKVLASIQNEVERMEVKEIMGMYLSQRKPITIRRALSEIHSTSNKIVVFLDNMGINYQDIINDLAAKGITVDVDWLMDPSHWNCLTTAKNGGSGTWEIILDSGRTVGFEWLYAAGYTLYIN